MGRLRRQATHSLILYHLRNHHSTFSKSTASPMSHLPAEFPNINDLPASSSLLPPPSLYIPIFRYVWGTLTSPLNRIPGPTLNKVSNLPMLAKQVDGSIKDYLNHLHDKYGKVVRLGPNNVAFMDKTDIKEILVTKDLPKNEAFLKTFRLDPAHSLPLRFYSTHSNHCPHQ
ncbi:hypothetical protein BC938DRAFT_481574 [Jimgerdemannia flammicorona]|uniref:Cytochrome P450 n=1 Tax=Jimgerdemannia flammicorona TaxID=994334 RepID=A0A433QFV3_9FUNG|nr:hypothetical protein BC938DRAFT_481574 [Jimgerdemannia flammicorona]